MGPELVPAEGEPLIHKRFNSSFEQTALEDGVEQGRRDPYRARWSLDQLVHSCDGVRRTGSWLRPDLVKDAHTTETMELETE